MSVRVRFAPSPTGFLHIGGLRTALYCYLFARAKGGSFILRIEDTDRTRGGEEYEKNLLDGLTWAGLTWDEGPFRQSERLSLYKEAAQGLVEASKAYPCFLSSEETASLTKKAQAEGKPPHFYHDRDAFLDPGEAKKRIKEGHSHTIRFKNPKKQRVMMDEVRGRVSWPDDTVGDFILIRSDGMPVYNFCCVVDDMHMGITHVIRADDHMNNTPRQLMLYEALGGKPPIFAHCSLILGVDGKKLSKRHGAVSVDEYKKKNYLPGALLNYLYLLGHTSPPGGDIFDVPSLGNSFSLSGLVKAHATYDETKLNHINGQHINFLEDDSIVDYFSRSIPKDSPFHNESSEKKIKIARLFAPRIQRPQEINEYLKILFEDTVNESFEFRKLITSKEGLLIGDYLKEKISQIQGPFVPESSVSQWIEELKTVHGIKGRQLFLGIRAHLTGCLEGPDLKSLVSLIPIKKIKNHLDFLTKKKNVIEEPGDGQ